MTLHLIILFLHILSSTVLFASGILTAMVMITACCRGTVQDIASAGRRVVISDWCLTCPSGFIQPVSGLWLALSAGYSLTTSWLLLTYALYIIAALCWFPVVGLQIRLAKIAEDAHRHQTPLPASFWKTFWWWFALGWPAFSGLVVVFWLMVIKPDLW